LLLVHTAVLSSQEPDRARQVQFNTQQVEKVWGKGFESVAVDFETGNDDVYKHDILLEKLTSILPVIGMMVQNKEHSTQEEENFDQVENEVLWYSGSAAASDLIPGVGLVSVPAIQAKMLHSLANQYGVEWNKRVFSELIGTLGSSFAVQYGMKLGTRQLVKLIPVYGQTVGAVAAAAMSFGTSYGLGRAACYYFYHKNRGEDVSEQEMQVIYKESLKKGKAASGYEEN
jgi:uncharacterized protein (DUF697 family)